DFGLMYCGAVYPDEGFDEETRSGLSVCLFRCVMENGIIAYPRPENCMRYFVKPMTPKPFGKERALELD
ncbi:MAG: type I-C CRISPR-associated protein Cas5, partial [Oscillospiraceae bacterium]